MARNHSGQMALYEALNKEKFRTAQKKELSRVAQIKSEKALPMQPVTIPPQQPKNADIKQTVWVKKTGMFGFNSGKVEAILPYPIAVTVVMGFLLLLIIAYQFGHVLGKHDSKTADVAKITEKSSEATVSLDTAKAAKELARSATKRGPASHALTPAATTTTVATERDREPAKGSETNTGEYVIVLAEVKNVLNAKDFEPAKQYFDEQGVATEIKNVRGVLFSGNNGKI